MIRAKLLGQPSRFDRERYHVAHAIYGHNKSAFLYVCNCLQHNIDSGENVRTPHGIARVWLEPSKEPRQDIDCAVFVAIHDESTFRATIGPFS